MQQSWKLAGALGLGAALVYVLDHTGGRVSRRQGVGRALRVRGRRWLESARRLVRLDQISARRLAARVRSTIAFAVSEPRAIDLNVEDGRVILRGPIPARELDSLLDAVWRTRGVDHVDVRLELLDSAEEMPVLERVPGEPSARRGWGPAFRMVAVLSGGGLAAYGLRRHDRLGSMMGVAGAGLTVGGLMSRRPRLRSDRRAS